MSVQAGAESLEAAKRAGRLTLTGDTQAVEKLLAATTVTARGRPR